MQLKLYYAIWQEQKPNGGLNPRSTTRLAKYKLLKHLQGA